MYVKDINITTLERRRAKGTIYDHHQFTFAIDGSEQSVKKSRLGVNESRFCSAKKQMHSINTLVIVSLDGKVLWISRSYPGNSCDKAIIEYGKK